jgi:predicted small secreted protein
MSRFRIASTLVLALSFACLALNSVGCNTVRGVGDDLKGASNATERAITGDPATKPVK